MAVVFDAAGYNNVVIDSVSAADHEIVLSGNRAIVTGTDCLKFTDSGLQNKIVASTVTNIDLDGDDAVVTGSFIRTVTVTGARNVIDGNRFEGGVSANGIVLEAASSKTMVGVNAVTRSGVYRPIVDSASDTVYGTVVPVPFSSGDAVLTTGDRSQPYVWTGGDGAQIVDVRAVVATAPTGDDIVIDIQKNGTSLWTSAPNQPTIAATTTDSGLTQPDQGDLIDNGDILTAGIDQVGSTVAGGYLNIIIRIVVV